LGKDLVQRGGNKATLRVQQSPAEGNPPAALLHHFKAAKRQHDQLFDF